MGLTREQFDIIYNKYNNRRLDNSIKQDKRLKEIYEKIPQIKECDLKISSLAVNAARSALNGDTSLKDHLKEDIANVSNQKKALLMANGYQSDYLEPIYDCPICKDTGFVNGQPCECLQKEVIKSLYTTEELNDILQKENFSTFNFDLYSNNFVDEVTGVTALDNIKDVVTFCKEFVDNFDNIDNNSILFYGRAGSGKTFLINCIAKELIEKSYSVIYLSAVQLFDLLADYSFKRSNTTIYRQISFDELLRCDLLIIDDLGTEMSNSFTESSLFDCLNERLIHQKSTIISTNFSLQELQQKYEERIFSRTAGNYTPLKIFGDDIRIKKFIN